MNRAQRRALEKQQRRAEVRPVVPVPTINPLFALDITARNRLATDERKAFEALLEHQATADDIGQLETLVETSIRAVKLCIAAPDDVPHLDPQALQETLRVFNRAAWAIKHAKARHEQTGVYGLDAADRAALIHAESLVAEMRKPGVILRKTWLQAFRESYQGKGVVIPAFEELETA